MFRFTRLNGWSAPKMLINGLILAGLTLCPVLGHAQQAEAPVAPGGVHDGRYVYSDLAQKVLPSVVTVYVKRDLRSSLSPEELQQMEKFRQFFDDPQLRRFFGPGQPTPDPGQGGGDDEKSPFIQKGSGSGVVISPDGYIITNWHVVGEAKDKAEISVVFNDDTEISGGKVKLIASSPLVDLALLKVEKTGLTPIKWGDSDKTRIGERVAAIGSPLDLRETISQGIISAKHREVGGSGLGDMIQTDTVINPGSSGGALVNLDGELVGINRMILTPNQTGRWEGYGFAIPSKDAQYFAQEVMNKGKVSYGYIGVMMAGPAQDTSALREALGLTKDQKGVVVMGVNPGTPAAEAGLQEGDMIVSADGTKIEDTGDLLGYVARRPIGTVVNMGVLRAESGGQPKQVEVKVKIAERPDEASLDKNGHAKPKKQDNQPQATPQGGNLGLQVEPYEENGVHGLRVTDVGVDSPAARAGIKEGDVLLQLNRVELKTADDLQKAIEGHKDTRPHLLKMLREGQPMLTTIRPDKAGADSNSK